MKILRIIYDWPPPWSGLAPHPYELTYAQTRLGHTFDIFCGWWPNAGVQLKPQGVTLHNFFREPLRGTINLTTSILLFFYYIFWMDKNDVHLVHSHGHFAIWIYYYRKFLKKILPKSQELKTPLVVHFHNTVAGRESALEENNQKITTFSKKISWPLARLSDQLAVQVADACIFVSKETLDDAIKFYNVDPAKCFVVESGVNIQKFSQISVEERDKSRRDLGIDLYDKVILYTGVMSERKGTHLLIESLVQLPANYKLLLVGSGDNDYMQKLTDAIKLNNLEKRVIRVGQTPYPQVHIAFQVADLFVMPSSFEGMPKVVLESLACKVPALASGFKLSEDIAGLFYLENLDVSTITRQIKSVIESKVDVDATKIRAYYSWDQKAREVEKIYANLFSQKL